LESYTAINNPGLTLLKFAEWICPHWNLKHIKRVDSSSKLSESPLSSTTIAYVFGLNLHQNIQGRQLLKKQNVTSTDTSISLKSLLVKVSVCVTEELFRLKHFNLHNSTWIHKDFPWSLLKMVEIRMFNFDRFVFMFCLGLQITLGPFAWIFIYMFTIFCFIVSYRKVK
jgi:hypothetical protein